MPIPRRRRFIIEPLNHEKGGSAGAPPIFEGHVPTGREMRDKDRRPAFDVRKYFRIGCWREPEREKASGLLLQLDKAESAVVEEDDLYGQAELGEAEEIPHQHGKPSVARQRDYLAAGERRLRADRLRHRVGH